MWECNSENIIKIGPYLPKLLQEKFGAVFLAHPVYALQKRIDWLIDYWLFLASLRRHDIHALSERCKLPAIIW